MSPEWKDALRRAPAPLALMALIFVLSDQPDLGTGLGTWDKVLRAGAHIVAYGALTLLWRWTLLPVTGAALPIAALIAFLYGISDEYHQSFVEGRRGSVKDLSFDVIGILLAALLLRYRRRPAAGGKVGEMVRGDE